LEPSIIEEELDRLTKNILRLNRFVQAFWVTPAETSQPFFEDTAKFESFGERKVNIGVKGLFGCTTIMIVSSRGAYVG
jgi:hypothetical protein